MSIDLEKLDEDFITQIADNLDEIAIQLRDDAKELRSDKPTIFPKMMIINRYLIINCAQDTFNKIKRELILTGVYCGLSDREECPSADTWKNDPYGHPIFEQDLERILANQIQDNQEQDSEVNKTLRKVARALAGLSE